MAYETVSQLVKDQRVQSRAGGLDEPAVERYVEAIEHAGGVWPFPAIDVFEDGDGTLRVGAGFHRLEAYDRYNAKHPDATLPAKIPANILKGGWRDAFLHNAQSNARHGLPFTDADKRNIVVSLLSDAEWGAWSDNVLSERGGVSQPMVSKVRKIMQGIALGQTDSEVALDASASTSYVQSIRALMPPPPAADKPAEGAAAEPAGKKGGKPFNPTPVVPPNQAQRTVKRGGKEFKMDTAKIGAKKTAEKKARAEAPKPEPPPATLPPAPKVGKKKKGKEKEYAEAVIAAEGPRIEALRLRAEALAADLAALLKAYEKRPEMVPASAGGGNVAEHLDAAIRAMKTDMEPAGVCTGCNGEGCVMCLNAGWLTPSMAPADEAPAGK